MIEILKFCTLIPLLGYAAYKDIKNRRIPDKLNLSIFALGLAEMLLCGMLILASMSTGADDAAAVQNAANTVTAKSGIGAFFGCEFISSSSGGEFESTGEALAYLLRDKIAGALVISLPMFVFAMAIPNSFGGGDIKMTAACGFCCGTLVSLAGALAGLLFAGVYGAGRMVAKRTPKLKEKAEQANDKEYLPLAPFLAAGYILAMMWKLSGF